MGSFDPYAAWSDAGKGRIRVMRADGSQGRDVVATPGHYTDPSFSPDGTLLAYTKGPHSRSLDASGPLPGELWLADADVARIAPEEGPREIARENGVRIDSSGRLRLVGGGER